jgi:O-antigen ligase
LVIAMGLIVTGSVSGMICGIGGCLVVLIVRGVKLRRIVAIAFLLALAYAGGTALQGATSSGHSLNPIARFEAATGPESGGANSVTPREGTWKGAWAGIENSPILGHGLDIASSLTYLDPNNNTYYPTHNLVLMGWFQGGMLFVFGELICIAEAIRRLFMNGRPDPTRATLFGGAVAVLLISMQAPTMFDRYFWFPFVLATTYPMATLIRRNGKEQTDEAVPNGATALTA